MKSWAWLLPSRVWKYFFAQFPKERGLVHGGKRFLVQLDEEFAPVYVPQPRKAMPKPTPDALRLLKSQQHH